MAHLRVDDEERSAVDQQRESDQLDTRHQARGSRAAATRHHDAASAHAPSAADLMATFIRDGRPGQSTTAAALVVSPAGASTGGHSTVIQGSFTKHGAPNLGALPPHSHATGSAAHGAIDALFAALGDRPFEQT